MKKVRAPPMAREMPAFVSPSDQNHESVKERCCWAIGIVSV